MKPTITSRAGSGLRTITLAALTMFTGILPTAQADEACMSPYMAKIVGQEDFVYIWTLGVEGIGDGQDKLVTVDGQYTMDHTANLFVIDRDGKLRTIVPFGFPAAHIEMLLREMIAAEG